MDKWIEVIRGLYHTGTKAARTAIDFLVPTAIYTTRPPPTDIEKDDTSGSLGDEQHSECWEWQP